MPACLEITSLNTRKAHDYQIMGLSCFAAFIRQISLEVAIYRTLSAHNYKSWFVPILRTPAVDGMAMTDKINKTALLASRQGL